MNLAAQDIAHYLKQHPLPAVTLIYGSEALLNSEALDAARARALADGYDERQRLYGDSRIDSLIQELETPSLFAPKRLLELHLDAKKTEKTAASSFSRPTSTNRTPSPGTKHSSARATSPSQARRSTRPNLPNKSHNACKRPNCA